MADRGLVEALERLVVGAVGMTAVALAEFSPAAELTLQQWRALIVVAGADGVRIGEIGSRLGMAPPSISRLVRRLERRGLVTSARDEADRRGTIVRPTALGLELRASLVDYRHRLIGDLLDTMSTPLPVGLADDLEQLDRAFARYA